MHVNIQSSDLFFVECLKGIFLVAIADNQAYYLTFISLSSDLTDSHWSRLVTVEPTRLLILELLDTDFTTHLTEYAIVSPYYPVPVKYSGLEDFDFAAPLNGAFS